MKFAPKRLKNIICLAGVATLLTFCVSGPQVQAQGKDRFGPNTPKWMYEIESVYPDKDYLAVIGEGDTRRAAENDAAGALSKIFISNISVESTAIMRYRELETATDSKSSTEKSIDKKVQVGSAQTLYNIQYGDLFTDNMGRVHLVGFLNRKETAKIYREKIAKNGERIVSFLKNMRESEGAVRRYAFIDAAVLFAKSNEVLLEQLLIIYEPMRKLIDLPYNLDELTKLYAQAAEQMSFSISITNDFDGKIAKMTGHILNTRGFTIAKGKSGALGITGEVVIEDTKLNNSYQNVRWTLILEMRDEKSQILVSFHKNQRESAVSRTEAVARSYREMEKQINDTFLGQFTSYLDGIILK